MIIAKEQDNILNKNILYTVCSIAQIQLVIIGDKEIFDTSIENSQLNKNSNLTELIEMVGLRIGLI